MNIWQGDRTPLTVEQLVAAAAERLAVSPQVQPAFVAMSAL